MLNRVVIVLALTLLAGAAVAPLAAQEQPDAAALLQYSVEKKSEWGAVALEWIVPIVGHAYAGDAKRGILPAVVTVAGATTFVMGIRCDSMCAVSGNDINNETLAWVGLAALVLGRTWSFVSAYNTASDHNEGLRSRLGITFEGAPGRLDAGVALRF